MAATAAAMAAAAMAAEVRAVAALAAAMAATVAAEGACGGSRLPRYTCSPPPAMSRRAMPRADSRSAPAMAPPCR